jgi:hypothetical protein
MYSRDRNLPFFSRRIGAFIIHHIVRRRWLSVTLIGLLGFGGSAVIGLWVGISEPMFHDEFSYLLAADTFAHGRLTNPTHPMWVHFESFHIIHQPTYMSKYPPAQSLALAMGRILAGHPIVGAWISFGLMCAAICWMLYGWMTPRWAVLGGMLALINPMLGIASYWAQSYWGGAVAASGGALLLGGVRRLMRRPHVSDALLTGAGLAVLANSRPYEGLLFSLPAAAFLLTWILSKRGPSLAVSVQRIVMPIFFVLILTGTAMGFYNFCVTGSALRLPYQVHEETYAVAPVFIWQDLRPEPAYRHRGIRDFHADYIPLYFAQHSLSGFVEKNIGFIWESVKYYLNVFAIPLLAAFCPLIRWALRNGWGRRALIIYAVLLPGLLLSTVTAVHYAAPITGLNYFFVLNAMRLWRWRHKRAGQMMLWLLPCVAMTALVVSVIYETNSNDNSSAWHLQRARFLVQLHQDQNQHLIIVRYGLQHSVNDEWVYNEADIDRAKVIWARDMNAAQNCKLIEYFRDRHIWLLEIDTDEPVPKLKAYPRDLCRRL